jgi:putative Mn2+ efflux pump MntP
MAIEKLTKNAQSLVAMAFVVGIGMVILSKFQDVSGISDAANTSIGEFVTGIGEYSDWIGIIVLVGVGVYLLKQFLMK